MYDRCMSSTAKPVTSIRIPPDLKERVEAEAARDGRNLTNMIVKLIDEAMTAREKKRK